MREIELALNILFKEQNPYKILERDLNKKNYRKNSYKNLEKDILLELGPQLDKSLSKDDFFSIASIIEEYLEEKMSRITLEKTVFNLILKYSLSTLNNHGSIIRCKYSELLRWRNITLKLDQDLFITAFIAFEDHLMGIKRKEFKWDTVIKSDNIRFHNMLSRGMAENHFHLKGSAPVFKVNWICLMNNYVKIDDIDKNFKNNLDNNMIENHRVSELLVVARALRVVILEEVLRKEEYKKGEREDKKDLKIIIRKIIDRSKKLTKEGLSYLNKEIQNIIDEKKFIKYLEEKKWGGDYVSGHEYRDESTKIFSGERELMYKTFQVIYFGDRKDRERIGDLFYAYIIIKNRVRAEFIQENGRFGFANFSEYQDRKTNLIKGHNEYSRSIVPLAILSSVKTQNIISLEARIIPEKTSRENIKRINEYDDAIINIIKNDGLNKWYSKGNERDIKKRNERLSKKERQPIDNEILEKIFYVFHFTKKKDGCLKNRCRHYSYRKELKEVSLAIAEMREKNYKVANRVLGIDACSNEIETRPEVYGQSFRFLKRHLTLDNLKVNVCGEDLRRLKATYHVGEDFLDVTDGLRAIYEAIMFLELRHGDRLGHVIALGINAKEWYKKKRYNVYLSKQEILDNIVWLIYMIKNYSINSGPDTIDKLITTYNKYYGEIYLERAKKDEEFYASKSSTIAVDTYIEGWKLRSDNPEFYSIVKKDLNHEYNFSFWNRCGIKEDVVRNNLAVELFLRYHYDESAKDRGSKRVVFNVQEYIVNLVGEIQEVMKQEISQLGIGIEANPSSNILINNFERYDNHPMLNLSDITGKKQMFVSINTDDQGIFDTLLENEYALMALALEKKKDEYGQKLYSTYEIYDWLDRIRVMGIEQSFR